MNAKSKKIIKITVWTLVAVLVMGFCLTAAEAIINISIKKVSEAGRDEIDMNGLHELLFYLEYPEKREEDGIVLTDAYIKESISPAALYMSRRYDCSDFATPSLIRLQYKHIDEITAVSPEGAAMIKNALLSFKYWMTEPGEDGMCYWSENHQMLFAAAEYLAGAMWPAEIFLNDGATGAEHKARAEKRIGYWLEHRYYYGFSEFNSANYLPFNLGPLANLIEFSKDPVMTERAKIVLDLALYDIASNMYNYTYSAPTGRAYASNMIGIAGDRVRQFTDYIWGLNENWKDNNHRMLLNFVSMMEGSDGEGNRFYEVPEVILDIARDGGTSVIKSSSGLNVSELKEKGYIGHEDEQIMMQLGMEAITNPEVIKNSVTYFSKNGLLKNSFFNDFKYFNLSVLKYTGLLGAISKASNPMPNGIAIQRANLYTYRTPYYKLATVQQYHPGSYGASQQLSLANFSDNAVVFTTHPARYPSAKNASATPGYWAGFGRAPSEVQYENIRLSIYQLPKKSGFLELYDVPQYTHTYLPEAFFDEVIIDGRYAFARVGSAYLALIGASDLTYLPYDKSTASPFQNGLKSAPGYRFDLIQNGLNQFWIYELGDAESGSFEDFCAGVKNNAVNFDGKNNLSYSSSGKSFSLNYDSGLTVDGQKENTEYNRFDSPYVTSEREAEEITFTYNGKTLSLNFNNSERECFN